MEGDEGVEDVLINQDQDLSASEKKMLLRIRDRLVGWLVKWLVGWLNGWLVGWLVGRLVGRLVMCSI